MKKRTLKIIALLSLIILIINVFNPISFAEDETDDSLTEEQQKEEAVWEEDDEGFGSKVLDGIGGILLLPVKLLVTGCARAIRMITGTIASIGGGSIGNFLDMSVDRILFNEVPLVKLDFFNISNETNATLGTLKRSIAQWYYILRNISLVILLGILIYVGIRMAISTVAYEEAKYKKMLENWIISIILLFLLHYIIILVLTVNNSLVTMLDNIRLSITDSSIFGTVMGEIAARCWHWRFTESLGNMAVYTILTGMTLIFLLSYIKRMVTVAFLIMISPLIVITYSIDKMGDGKSQALNTWLKEFSYNVLIQPFHCIIYLSLVTTGINLMHDTHSLGSAVLAVVLTTFIWTAEDIVKKIFGFEASSMAKTVASAAVVTTALSKMGKDKKGAKGAENAGGGSGSGKGSGAGARRMPNMAAGGDFGLGGGSGSGKGAGSSKGSGSGGGRSSGGRSGSGGRSSSGSGSGNTVGSKLKATGARIGSGLANGAINVAKAAPSAAFKIAMAGFGLALGASTGSGKTALIGLNAGRSLADKAETKFTGSKEKRMEKSNKRALATATNNYKNRTGADDEQVKRDSKRFLRMSDKKAETNLTDDQKEYRRYLKGMQETYKAQGMNKEDSSKAVLNTLDEIQEGKVKPFKEKN